MSKFRKRVIKGLENILDHIRDIGDIFSIDSLASGICDVNTTRNSGKVQRDVSKYLSLYFDFDDYHWPAGKIAPRKKWLKEHIKRLKELEN